MSHYSPQGYPPQQQAYPPQGYPPQGYPPPQHGYPPGPGYPPPQHGYPPQPVMAKPLPMVPRIIFRAPPGSRLAPPPPGSKAQVVIKIQSARNLIAADSNGYSDPFVKVLAPSAKKDPSTKAINKTLNPVWNETFLIELDNYAHDVIVLQVYDKDKIGADDPIGYTVIDPSLLPKACEVSTNEQLSWVKHGELQISCQALNFGVEGAHPGYPGEYVFWRNSLPAISKKGKEKEKSHVAKVAKGKFKREIGPYASKITPKGFFIENCWVKVVKKEENKTLKKGLKMVSKII